MLAGVQSVTGPVLHAFAAWLKLSAGAGLDGPALAGHPLTKAAMEGLSSLETFEDASDAVCELIMCTSTRGEPEPQMMPLVQLLVPAVSVKLSCLNLKAQTPPWKPQFCLESPPSRELLQLQNSIRSCICLSFATPPHSTA